MKNERKTKTIKIDKVISYDTDEKTIYIEEIFLGEMKIQFFPNNDTDKPNDKGHLSIDMINGDDIFIECNGTDLSIGNENGNIYLTGLTANNINKKCNVYNAVKLLNSIK